MKRYLYNMQEIKSSHEDRPNFHPKYFWEYHFDRIDWRKHDLMVIERILERGNENDWKELVRFYSEERVVHTVKNVLPYLTDDTITRCCAYFHLRKEELRCYIRKQSLPGHWF